MYWLAERREALAFGAMVGLPLAALAGIVYLARESDVQVQPLPAAIVPAASAHADRRSTELKCLADNVYFEARGEPLDGQYAVAEVTLNRRWAPNFPRTVCEVVHESRWDPLHQRFVADFSWTELGALSAQDGPAWRQAVAVATSAYDDTHPSVVPGALFYHATSVRPDWSRTKTVVAKIGNHIFYR